MISGPGRPGASGEAVMDDSGKDRRPPPAIPPRRDSKERYRTATDGLQEGVLFKSAAGVISGWNPSAQRILGSTLERQGADAVTEDGSLVPPEEQPEALALRSGLPSPRVVLGISREGGGPG